MENRAKPKKRRRHRRGERHGPGGVRAAGARRLACAGGRLQRRQSRLDRGGGKCLQPGRRCQLGSGQRPHRRRGGAAFRRARCGDLQCRHHRRRLDRPDADGERAAGLRDQHDGTGAGHPRAAAAAQEARQRRDRGDVLDHGPWRRFGELGLWHGQARADRTGAQCLARTRLGGHPHQCAVPRAHRNRHDQRDQGRRPRTPRTALARGAAAALGPTRTRWPR